MGAVVLPRIAATSYRGAMDPALKIGEVARRTGLTVRTLHHYDSLGLLTPSSRTWGDHRLYTAADLRRLLAIQHLRSLGLSLAEIGSALDDPSFDARDSLHDHIRLVEERLAAEETLLVRLRGLRDAAEVGWHEMVEAIALTQRLAHPEPNVRARAALDATSTTPLPALIDQLADEPDPAVNELLTWAVARHGADAFEPLASRLNDPDAGVRARMVHALGKLRDKRAVGLLQAMLRDPDAGVRTEITVALGRLGGSDAMIALVSLLGDPDEHLREAVTDALALMGDAVPEVTGVLAAGDPPARLHAAEILGHLASPDAVDALAAAVADPDADVRLASLFSLGRCPGDTADRAIRHALASDDPRLQTLARRLAADRGPVNERRQPRSGRTP